MARYIYEWKQTEHGRRLFRRPGTGPRRAAAKVAPAPEPEPEPDISALKKDELIELAEARGVDASGTKADIIERLDADGDE